MTNRTVAKRKKGTITIYKKTHRRTTIKERDGVKVVRPRNTALSYLMGATQKTNVSNSNSTRKKGVVRGQLRRKERGGEKEP